MTISSIQSSGLGGVGSIDLGNYSGALTDDVLLQYCQSRLNGIDQQVDTQFNQQKQLQNATSNVNDAQSVFEQNPGGLNYAQSQQALTSLQAADAALPTGDQQKAKLEQEIHTLASSMSNNPPTDANPNPHVIDQKDVQPYSDALSSISKDIGSEAEMQMMTLQSLISQRQTAVQMCTSMISSLDDTKKSIAQKMGPKMPAVAIDALYGLGHWLLAQERATDALHVFRTLLTSAPDDERGWLGLGTCHERFGHFATARELYTLGAATVPASFRCSLAQARVHRRAGADNLADAAFEIAIERAEAICEDDIATAIANERAAA